MKNPVIRNWVTLIFTALMVLLMLRILTLDQQRRERESLYGTPPAATVPAAPQFPPA